MRNRYKHILFSSFILLFFAFMLFVKCKKDETVDNTNNTNIAATIDNTLSESIFNTIFQDVNTFYNNELLSSFHGKKGGDPPPPFRRAKVVLFPFDTTSWPKTLDIDYGDTNVLGFDNNIHKGRIHTVFSSDFQRPGSEVTIVLDNYYLNNCKIEGTKIIKNKGRNLQHHLVFSEYIKDAQINKQDGSVIKWSQVSDKEWIEGELTRNIILDDVYKITGNRSGTDSKGNNYSVLIAKPLIIALNCKWIKEGIINFDISNIKYPVSIDYGNGTCDPDAILTVNDKKINLTLK